MTSTAIFAELLVVGLQATVWVALLCLGVADVEGVQFGKIVAWTRDLKEWAALITTFVLGFAYTLGIIVDRSADSLASAIEKKFSVRKKKEDVKIPMKRLHVMSKSADITKFLEYIRSRMRIARSTSLNLLLITIAAVFLWRHSSWSWILTIVVVGVALIIISTSVSRRIASTYDKRLRQAYKHLAGAKPG